MTEKYLETAIKAAKTSGQILVNYFEKLHDLRQKSGSLRDLVTEVDVLSEKNAKKIIKKAFPEHGINAEESGLEKSGREKNKLWHIDAIDGTVNYSQGIPLCCVSVALQEGDDVTVGVVFNPFSDELYFATKGGGAYLNGRQISVSKKKDLKDGIYVAAFSNASSGEKKREYEVFGKINDSTRGVLRLGSAALSLAYLSSSKIDGFWAKNLFPWDLAAGLLLVREAGGKVTSEKGSDFRFENKILIASNGALHKQLAENVSALSGN